MLFPTVEFAIFFFFVFIVSWQMQDRANARKVFLVLASYFFYAFWDWRFVSLLFACTLFNYFFAIAIDRTRKKVRRKAILVIACVFNLGLLCFFKYFGFFAVSLSNLLLVFGIKLDVTFLNIVLPIGISFFTFQATSYVIDVYRKKLHATRSFLDLMLYKSFFPQLVAGPIVRAIDFLPQIESKEKPLLIASGRPFILIISGLFKKIIIAHYISTLFVDPIFANPKAFSTIELILGTYAYALQIYCDFSAYSDIAIGVAALLGYDFMDNFNLPYRAVSIRDFWRRWHISLSTWLRDYLYIPLGGSKKGKRRTWINLLVTMILGGLWHGAAWKFLIWGFIHGAGQAVERFVFKIDPDKKRNIASRALMVFVTFNFVCFSWIFFRAQTLPLAFEYLASLGNIVVPTTLLSPFVAVLLFVGLGSQFIPIRFREWAKTRFSLIPVPIKGLALGSALVVIGSMASEGIAPFIYFQF
jgi:alginate O-acetyltransferase complex protein AlgI